MVRSTGEDAHVYDPVRLLRLVGEGFHLHHEELTERLMKHLTLRVMQSDRTSSAALL
jgi:hypothetical protein